MKALVIQASSLHLGYLGCYGNNWIGTPNLDRLAAEGVVFDQHYVDDPASTPFCQPTQSNVDIARVTLEGIADFGAASLSAVRKSSASVVWIDGSDLTPPWNLPKDLQDVYFDEQDQDSEPWLDPTLELAPDLSISELLELQNTYAAAVTWFDAQLGELVDALRDAGELDETLLCVTAQAGLPLGEHGAIGTPRAWLHEELVHVPLVVRFPKSQYAGSRVSALTQPADLLPTIRDDSLDSAAGSSGYNLMPLLRGEVESVRPYACSHMQSGVSIEWALRSPEWALLLPIQVPEGDVPRGPQLYVKPDDRWEVNDVGQHHLEFREALEHVLRAFKAKGQAPGPIIYPPLPAF